MAKVLEFQLEHHSFQRNPRPDLLQNGLDGSPCSPRDSQESSPTPQFKSINSSVFSFLHSPTLTSIHDHWKTIALTRRTFVGKVISLLFNMLSRLVIGEGNGTPLQYSCLENPMDEGAWRAAVHGVTEGQIRLRDFTLTFHFHALEKEMATHSSVLAWRIPGTGEPGGLLSMGSHSRTRLK